MEEFREFRRRFSESSYGSSYDTLMKYRKTLYQRRHYYKVALERLERGEKISDGVGGFTKDHLETLAMNNEIEIADVSLRLSAIRYKIWEDANDSHRCVTQKRMVQSR